MDLSWKFFSLSKFRGMSLLWKKSNFSIFSCPHREKFQTILNWTILKFDALPIAHFETYVPLFLKNLWKLAISLKLWVPAASEVRWSRTVSKKNPHFRVLFWINHFFLAKPNQETPPSVIHGWKATDLPFMMVKRKNILFIQWSVRFLVTPPERLLHPSWQCVVTSVFLLLL